MASGGTEAFPDLGKHCQLLDCHQLDFLPFTCDGCKQVFVFIFLFSFMVFFNISFYPRVKKILNLQTFMVGLAMKV